MVNSVRLLLIQLVAHINNVQQHVCLHDLFERRLEGRHKLMRQTLDKANGIRQNSLLLIGQLQLTRRRIKRCKQLILCVDIRISQRIQKR